MTHDTHGTHTAVEPLTLTFQGVTLNTRPPSDILLALEYLTEYHKTTDQDFIEDRRRFIERHFAEIAAQ